MAQFPSDVVQLAQQYYDETEDHYGQLKSAEDEDATEFLESNLQKLITDNGLTDEAIEKFASEMLQRVKNSNSDYFQKAFPVIFQWKYSILTINVPKMK